MKSTTRESVVLWQCLELLRLRGMLYWRNQTGAFRTGTKGKQRFVRFGAVGSSDIMAVLPPYSKHAGRFMAIECKRPGGKTTPAQDRFLANVRDNNGIAIVVDDVLQLDELLTDLGV